jgi:hypothetical protein
MPMSVAASWTGLLVRVWMRIRALVLVLVLVLVLALVRVLLVLLVLVVLVLLRAQTAPEAWKLLPGWPRMTSRGTT